MAQSFNYIDPGCIPELQDQCETQLYQDKPFTIHLNRMIYSFSILILEVDRSPRLPDRLPQRPTKPIKKTHLHTEDRDPHPNLKIHGFSSLETLTLQKLSQRR